MKKLAIFIVIVSLAFTGYSQDNEPTFTKVDDMVKVTYYYDNGHVKTEGFFKDKKLTGQWVTYDTTGKRIQLANYKDGKKVGTWLIWTKDGIREINYVNNKLISVHFIKEEYKLASN